MDDPAARILAELTAPGGPFEISDGRFVRLRASLRDWLEASRGFGEREYLVQDGERVSYADHYGRVGGLAACLAGEHGVQAGDRVAILGANSPAWVTAFWAATSLGAVVAAGNAWWTPREAEASLRRARPAVVLADDKRAPLAAGLGVPVLPLDVRPDADEPPVIAVEGEAPAVIVYTSGTTGTPKGAVHSHRALLAIVEYHRLMDALATAMAAAYGLPARQEPRRFLMSMPLFHIGSLHNLAVPRLATGDTLVIDRGAFDADRVLSLIERERITNWAVVPTMASRVVGRAGAYDVSSLTALSINSAPSSPAVRDGVRAAVPSVQIVDSYGLTESGTAATLASPADLAVAPTSVGRAVPSVTVSIRDADGVELPEGTEGEIWVHSQFAMSGYDGDPEATDAVLRDGWLRTGDLGTLRDGRLYVASRRSDLILRGGENVYPAEVEAALGEHPDVVEAAVFGVAHADLGQEVAAVVVGDVDPDKLRPWLAERLAYYKVPTRWRVTSQPLPRTATGKIVRSGLHLAEGS
jgi:acyl-CoA synthetase (AMP-forming)/AMP-acid ligase II